VEGTAMRTLARIGLSLAVFSLLATFADADDKPVKCLIITGDHGHDWKATTEALEKFLKKDGHIDVSVTTTPSKDLTAENLAKYDVYLLNYRETKPKDETRWTDQNKKALVDAVKGGKGLVVYHFASSAFPEWDEYERMIAGGWRKQGHHGPRHKFKVKKTHHKHAISQGLDDEFEHNSDELYANSKMVEGNEVLATAYSDPAREKGTGKDEPVIWINTFGKGRVYHNALGHDVEALSDPALQEWLRRGVIWAGGGELDSAK
jgi:type 1 glutamine amidotransferase